MTVTRANAHELQRLYALCLEMGADALHLFMLVPVGCGVQIAESDMLSPHEYEQCLHWMYERELERRLELKATCAPHYFRVMRQRGAEGGGPPPSLHRQDAKGAPAGHQALHQTTKGCLAGQGVCFISHKGEVFPCGYLPVPAGHLRRQRFAEVWENSPVFQRLRDPEQLEGKCGACSFKFVCGGCRARAFYATGSFLSEEPYCAYVPHNYHKSQDWDAL
jgi:radical SAM protein with 4Fe4S-binding SPASM domain